MQNNLMDLDALEVLLNRPYDTSKALMWLPEQKKSMLLSVERLEYRLCLLFVVCGSPWRFEARPSPTKEREAARRPVATRESMAQAETTIDGVIARHLSKRIQVPNDFPIYQILKKLLVFKDALLVCPMEKLVVRHVVFGLEKRGNDFGSVDIMPSDAQKQMFWYKSYGMYKSILFIMNFPAEVMTMIDFKSRWLDDDESVNIVMAAYGIYSDTPRDKMMRLIDGMEIRARKNPMFRNMVYAIKHSLV